MYCMHYMYNVLYTCITLKKTYVMSNSTTKTCLVIAVLQPVKTKPIRGWAAGSLLSDWRRAGYRAQQSTSQIRFLLTSTKRQLSSDKGGDSTTLSESESLSPCVGSCASPPLPHSLVASHISAVSMAIWRSFRSNVSVHPTIRAYHHSHVISQSERSILVTWLVIATHSAGLYPPDKTLLIVKIEVLFLAEELPALLKYPSSYELVSWRKPGITDSVITAQISGYLETLPKTD